MLEYGIYYQEDGYVRFLRAEGIFKELCINPNDNETFTRLKEEGDSGNVWAQVRVAECYLKKLVKALPGQIEDALNTLDELSGRGLMFAKLKKAQYFLQGDYAGKEEKSWAKSMLEVLSFAGYCDAAFVLGCYYAKRGNAEKALRFLEEADKQGHPAAREQIGRLSNLNVKYGTDTRGDKPKKKSKGK